MKVTPALAKSSLAVLGFIATLANPAGSIPTNVQTVALAGQSLVVAAYVFGEKVASLFSGSSSPPVVQPSPELVAALKALEAALTKATGS